MDTLAKKAHVAANGPSTSEPGHHRQSLYWQFMEQNLSYVLWSPIYGLLYPEVQILAYKGRFSTTWSLLARALAISRIPICGGRKCPSASRKPRVVPMTAVGIDKKSLSTGLTSSRNSFLLFSPFFLFALTGMEESF